MKRHKHSLSNYKLLTCDMGELVPIGMFEVLPGDSIQQATSLLVRLSPLVSPVMHPVVVRVHHWYVPTRLVWPQFEDFITGGPDGLNSDVPPTIAAPATTGWLEKSLPDYLGIPTGWDGFSVNAMPIRAFNEIYNENYRDEDIAAIRAADTVTIPKIAWEKDYFSMARPWAQKGSAVTIPLGGIVPVESSGATITVRGSTGTMTSLTPSAGGAGSNVTLTSPTTVGQMNFGNSGTSTTGLRVNLASAAAANVDDVRRAFALQRYKEARARYGSRYVEYLRYLGISPSDARLQRPEYLGGGKQTISFSEVLQTGPDTTDEGVGNLKGHGIAAMRSRRYRKYIEEHGYVLSLLSVRPRAIYTDGLNRSWSKTTKEDWWQKELENIGQQQIQNSELYIGASPTPGTFGYSDRYAEYRTVPSTVAGEFRSTLNYWHLARQFAAQPVLNQSFTDCVPSKRIFAEQTTNSLLIMANHSIQCRRMVSKNAAGRIY